jgi:hypothetical protein
MAAIEGHLCIADCRESGDVAGPVVPRQSFLSAWVPGYAAAWKFAVDGRFWQNNLDFHE